MANQKKELKIRIPENLQPGAYANNSLVSHTREEFILDFMMAAPPTGTVVSRVILNPAHLKRFITTLQTNLQKYEQAFGPVQAGEIPPMKMGLSG